MYQTNVLGFEIVQHKHVTCLPHPVLVLVFPHGDGQPLGHTVVVVLEFWMPVFSALEVDLRHEPPGPVAPPMSEPSVVADAVDAVPSLKIGTLSLAT